MKLEHPKAIKIYEAIGSVADERVEVTGDKAKVYSSTDNKFYEVSYDPLNQAIMANDNSSYWQGSLGYPAIAYLLKIGVLEYRSELARLCTKCQTSDVRQKKNRCACAQRPEPGRG